MRPDPILEKWKLGVQIARHVGVDEQSIKSALNYGWWQNAGPSHDPPGFAIQVYFPVGLLPAVTLVLWRFRLDAGWFLE